MTATTRSGTGRPRTALALTALFFGTFVMGSAELIVVGILDLVAADLGVPIGTAGSLVTGYALGISVGGPVLTALTIRFARRPLLQLSLAAYVLVNGLAVAAASFGLLLVARVLTGALHGLFIGVAFAVGASVMPPEKRGKAISFVFGGTAVATALGVPVDTLIGQGLGWEASFAAIVAAGVLALAPALVAVPPVPDSGIGGFGAQAGHAFAPKVLALLGLAFLVMGGQFAGLTYLQPFLADVTGVSGGTFAGGAAADRDASATIVFGGIALVLALAALTFLGSNPVVAAIALFVWGIVGFGVVPSIQHRVVSLAGPGRDLAATLPASAVTLGIAIGALVGGSVVGGDSSGPMLVSLVVCAAGAVAAWATSFLEPDPEAAR
ncbi:MFS transporter [Saccharothrix sp. S26]|uniref:MFS transporter n=1 Tax=Saccharothrix sp. S26 TaxID=2907215 RepID=UPI001F2099BF|nr:MFS transporter [Saccharothrix sp. S26]MCE6997130.1 MFS transporter [Saccharothrix sp. S26]